MQTIVFIGNSTTEAYDGFMITPRGYAGKYDIARGKGDLLPGSDNQNA
jgi:hypothetical protein